MNTFSVLGRLVLVDHGQPFESFFIEAWLKDYCQRKGILFFTIPPKNLTNPYFFSSSPSPLACVVILGTRSDYDLMTYLSRAAKENLIQYAKSGGSIVGIDRGFGMLCSRYNHISSFTKSKVIIPALGLLPGVTHNTLEQQLVETRCPTEAWQQMSVTPIRFTNLQSTHNHPNPMVYWDGPSFFPYTNDIMPLMNYAGLETEKYPLGELAAVMRKVDDGSVLGIGPHPEISSELLGSNLFAHWHLHHFCKPQKKHFSQLQEQLRIDEKMRLSYLATMFDLNLQNSAHGSRSLRMGRLCERRAND